MWYTYNAVSYSLRGDLILKKLTVNIYRYVKYLAIGLVLAGYPGYVLYQYFFVPDYIRDGSVLAASGWLIVGVAVIFVVGSLFVLYGVLSLIVNRAEFDEDEIRYRTLFKNYVISCREILHVTERRQTVQKTGVSGLFSTTKSEYRLVTKTRNYDMNSFEFWGLDKEIQKVKEMVK